jgi:hypothetical protein
VEPLGGGCINFQTLIYERIEAKNAEKS